jgi:hypothetical protein
LLRRRLDRILFHKYEFHITGKYYIYKKQQFLVSRKWVNNTSSIVKGRIRWKGFSGGEFAHACGEKGLFDAQTNKFHHDATVYNESLIVRWTMDASVYKQRSIG